MTERPPTPLPTASPKAKPGPSSGNASLQELLPVPVWTRPHQAPLPLPFPVCPQLLSRLSTLTDYVLTPLNTQSLIPRCKSITHAGCSKPSEGKERISLPEARGAADKPQPSATQKR